MPQGPQQSSHTLRFCSVNDLDASYRIVFMPQGLGDILYFLMYATEYRRLIPEPRLAVVVIKKHFLNLVELFAERIDAVCLISMDEEPYLRHRFTYFYDGIYNRGPQRYLCDAVRLAIGLPATAEAFLPRLERPADMDEKEKQCGLIKNRTILIAPDAVSCNADISDEMWIKAADICQEKGFKVFFNTNDVSRFGSYPTAFFPLAETIQFVNDGNGFIGFRSGLCDVLAAFTSANMLLLYPNNKKEEEFPGIIGYSTDPNGAYMRYCSLKNIFPEKPIKERIYNKERFLESISQEVSSWQDC